MICAVAGVCGWGNSGIAGVKVVGYYTSWNVASLPFNKIEYSNLTDIIVAFGTPNSNGSVDFSGLSFPGLITSAHNAGVKVLVSLGGASSGSAFSAATGDSVLTATLINSVVSFLQQYNYDGVDIDWETPSNSTETQQLTGLVQGMRAKFNQTDSAWLITMAIPATSYGGQHFDYNNLTGYVDWYNVMCYDFVGSWCTYSGHDSPLYFNSRGDPNQAGADSDAIVYNHVSRGIPQSKLVMGLPFYSDLFYASGLYKKLSSSTTTNPYYQDVMDSLNHGWKYTWDNASEVPWLENAAQTQFITFEDTNSVKLKVQYASRQQLGGIMIWELSQDIYNGGQPLLEAINAAVRNLTAVAAPSLVVVSNYKLYDNYPNPFNPATKIDFDLPSVARVTLKIYDVLGREVAKLVDGQRMPGKYEVGFDGGKFPSGVYFYTFTSNGFSQTKKMLLLK